MNNPYKKEKKNNTIEYYGFVINKINASHQFGLPDGTNDQKTEYNDQDNQHINH
jgi:hypothetical protein